MSTWLGATDVALGSEMSSPAGVTAFQSPQPSAQVKVFCHRALSVPRPKRSRRLPSGRQAAATVEPG